MLETLSNLGRIREISTVLVRHGFGEIVMRAGFSEKDAPSQKDAELGEHEKRSAPTYVRIRRVLTDLGPSFIKLGQIVSTRADLLPLELIAELKKLQQEVPPIPFSAIASVIEEDLGAPLSSLFVSFVEEPLAAASIGQVHRAVLATPEGNVEVVVKVQRPGVKDTVARDLNLLRRMAVMLESAIPETRIYSPVALVAHFDRSITAELDFAIEAEHAERFAHNFADVRTVRFPRVYRQASAHRVLTMEFFPGDKVYQAIDKGHSGPRLAKQAVGLVIKMIFEDGFFHADPHPGNILILGQPEEPVLGLIDLGMVGRLSPELRDRTVDLMVAAARRDGNAVADALYAIGHPTRKVDMRAYRAEVSTLAEKYLGKALKDIELSSLVRDLVQGALKYGIEIPPDFMLVGKALMTIEGIGKQLDPNLDVMGEAAPYFVALVRQRYSPKRMGNELLRGIEQLSRVGYDLPLQLREVLDDLRLGRLTLLTTDPALPRAAQILGQKLSAALISATVTLVGTLLVCTGRGGLLGPILLSLGLLLCAVRLVMDRRS